jgi:hypothetical protein
MLPTSTCMTHMTNQLTYTHPEYVTAALTTQYMTQPIRTYILTNMHTHTHQQYVTAAPTTQYMAQPTTQYMTQPTTQYVTQPTTQYMAAPTTQYVTQPTTQYVTQGAVAMSPTMVSSLCSVCACISQVCMCKYHSTYNPVHDPGRCGHVPNHGEFKECESVSLYACTSISMYVFSSQPTAVAMSPTMVSCLWPCPPPW